MRSPTFAALDHDVMRTGIVFCLVLIGCGSKAGLVPLHAWLPLAHPAAPSHVSALMSGVMTKVAIYGFIRIVFDLLGPPQTWWSVVVLSIGGVTAVLGVLHAMLQDDLKRLLAYSTVENVGIIFIGLGLALAFESGGIHWAAALAFVAALFHVFNHSLFKSLLFYGAGAVHATTHERDMEHLGGLIHRMPVTAFAFLIGAMAIAALPPLNGFVSEWLTFQAILVSPQLSAWGLKFLIPAVGAMLALSAALAAACFVKAYGLTFLGRPRSSAAQTAHEAHPASRAAMIALVALCVAAGILPGYVIDALSPLTDALVGGHLPLQADQAWLTIVPIDPSRSSYNGLFVFLFTAIAASLAAFVIHRIASREVRRAPAWDCGYPGCESRAAILGRQLRATGPARVRHAAVPGARDRHDAEAGRRRRRAFSRRDARSDLGVAVPAGRALRRFRRRTRERVAAADDPAVSRPGVHRAGRSAVVCWRSGNDQQTRRCNSVRCCSCCCSRRC